MAGALSKLASASAAIMTASAAAGDVALSVRRADGRGVERRERHEDVGRGSAWATHDNQQ